MNRQNEEEDLIFPSSRQSTPRELWRLSRRAVPIGVLPWLALAVADDGSAQNVPDARVCPACVIEAEVIAELGDVDGPGALANVRRIAIDGGDRYWVFSDLVPTVFDRDGGFLRTVGRRGEGPGEFRSASDLVSLPDDSVLVRDGVRWHVFDPDLTFIRTIQSPLLGLRDVVVRDWPEELVANALDPHPAHFGLPFHVLAAGERDAEVTHSFGELGEVVTQSSMHYLLPHALEGSAEGGYWSLAAGLYDITRWSPGHREEFTLERRPEWFPGRSDLGGGGLESPPRPRCVGLSEDEQGWLWTFCLVASPNWRDALERVAEELERAREAGGAAVGMPASWFDDHLLHHTWIEVINPESRRVVASHYLEASVLSVLPGRRAAVLTYSPEGAPVVRVYRFSIQR